MNRSDANAAYPKPANRRVTGAAKVALAALCVSSLIAAGAVASPGIRAGGFAQPFAGTPKYQRFAPTETVRAGRINQPLGMSAVNRIARELGLNRRDVFTARQYRLLVSGKGVGGEAAPAKLIRESVRILTNTTGTPAYVRVNGKLTPVVLGSYGLMATSAGILESPANIHAPTRQINNVIQPHGYFPAWCRHNGAQASLRMLYRSAYTSEAAYGFKAQQQSGKAQLVPNQKGVKGSIVGMSMAPPLWIVNFALMYTVNPEKAAKMPAYWTPIPAKWRWPSQKAALGKCGTARTNLRSPARSLRHTATTRSRQERRPEPHTRRSLFAGPTAPSW
jgi:hypothetical protein